jgi:hypothetical protein
MLKRLIVSLGFAIAAMLPMAQSAHAGTWFCLTYDFNDNGVLGYTLGDGIGICVDDPMP